MKIKIIECLKNEKSFQNEIKYIFLFFKKALFYT